MKLLFLSKRRPQGRDLLTRPYGRFFHLPHHLAERGHDVTLLLLSYRPDPFEQRHQHDFEWISESLRPVLANRGPLAYLRRAEALIREQRPDWIIGLSDTWYGILAQWLGSRHGIKTLIDAYDNYESYLPGALPLHWAWRRALRRATALTAAGPALAERMSRGRRNPATMVPMAADPLFQPMNRTDCREQLGLPPDVPLVGYCGSLYRNRGIEPWFRAFERLCRQEPELRWVISGRRGPGLVIPAPIRSRIIELGYLPDERMPLLLNAMDVLLVLNRPSAFGQYSYPAKLYEAMRCQVTVVASDVAGSRWIMRDHPECLADSTDPEGFAERVAQALQWGRKCYSADSDWAASALCLEQVLLDFDDA